ncbi:MAG: hypothetical protein WBW33_35705, partial [Bryobacteraceae bacterium]
ALLYPGVAMLEALKNYSVGRGTDAPFEQVGADWIKGVPLAELLNGRYIPGVRVYPTQFRPTASNFAGREVEGVRLVVTDRESFDSVLFGLELAAGLQGLFPGHIDWVACKFLIGNQRVIDDLKNGVDPKVIAIRLQQEDLAQFAVRRRAFLLY